MNGTVTALNPITTFPPIQNEFSATRSNLVGTLAMAKLGNDPNSATSQWFVNLGDNSANLDSQNGGFTVFGKVLGDGMTLINAVNSLPTYDLRASFGGAFEAVPKFNNGASFVTVTKAAVVPPTGSLSGFVYLDANHNGVRDALDYALADAQVSVMQAGSNTVLATVQSGKDGSYSLGGLPAGTYSVKMQTPTSVAGQDNGSQQKILDKNGSVVSTGLVGTVQPNACNNVVLGEYQTGQNFSFAEAAYPAALMSSRMLLNDYAGVPSVGTIAGTSTNAASTSLLATTVPDSIAVPGGGNASANSSGVTPVPEPGSLVLLVVGGLALGGLAWRRRNGR